MNFYVKILIFLLINFGALGLGGILQGEGPMSDWYQNLNIAPWTPPGWVFGAAWTTIMVCFSVYMAYLTREQASTLVLGLFAVQFVLNVAWNPLFFNLHMMGFALVVLLALLLLVGYMLFGNLKIMGAKSWLLAPYFVWLIIATSLNVYALLNN